MKKTALMIFSALMGGMVCSAQVLPSLLVGEDPSAMGAAGVSLMGAEVYGMQGIGAAAALMEGTAAAGVSYGSWQPSAAGDKLLGASASVRFLDRFSVSVAYKAFNEPEYEVTGNTGSVSQVTPTFTPKENSVGAALGFRVMDGISVALGVRSTSSAIGPNAKASVLGFDVSAMYAKDRLRAAAAVCNLGGKVNYGGDDWSQPALGKVSATYAITDAITAGAQAEYLFEGAFGASLAAQYCWNSLLLARAGYHLGSKDLGIPSYASAGLGVRFAGVSIDASYLLASDTLGGSFLIGAGFAF